jgi:hypothetical protein
LLNYALLLIYALLLQDAGFSVLAVKVCVL